MPVINRIAEYFDDMKGWRQHIHANPELSLDCHKTAAFVVERLREFGITEIHEGIAESGVVAIIKGRGEGPTIGLRADMDALPLQEKTGLDYASKIDGKMHACGHDGHTAMLLGAAKYLAETRNFSGRVALIFQPAEETVGGARMMCEEGVIENFNISQVYAMHNLPGLPVGLMNTRPGPVMAAADEFRISIHGKGGHAAMPHGTIDPVMVAVQIAQSLQTIITRNMDPIEKAVLSITQIHAGTAGNIVPDDAMLAGTVRTFSAEVRDMIEQRLGVLAQQIAAGFGATVTVQYDRGYPPTINSPEETAFAVQVAAQVVGEDNARSDIPPTTGAEDFAYFLEKCPGAYVVVGNGDSAGLHHPEFNFNDEASPIGASYFVKLVENAQPVSR